MTGDQGHRNDPGKFFGSKLIDKKKQPAHANCYMLGQAPLLTHAIMVGFSIFLVYVVITTLTSIKNDYQQVVGGDEVKSICFVMKSAIDKVYYPDSYNLATDTNLGSVDVDIPEKIAGIKYSANFFNKSIIIKSSPTLFNETCKIGYNVAYSGSTSGGLTRFSYLKYTNGTQVIEMMKV